jgi:hypothetical protein
MLGGIRTGKARGLRWPGADRGVGTMALYEQRKQ